MLSARLYAATTLGLIPPRTHQGAGGAAGLHANQDVRRLQQELRLRARSLVLQAGLGVILGQEKRFRASRAMHPVALAAGALV